MPFGESAVLLLLMSQVIKILLMGPGLCLGLSIVAFVDVN